MLDIVFFYWNKYEIFDNSTSGYRVQEQLFTNYAYFSYQGDTVNIGVRPSVAYKIEVFYLAIIILIINK